jgi:hypothetical protein
MSTILLAQDAYQYQPFLTPLPVWDYWILLLIPMCLVIGVVYKSAKCESRDQLMPQAIKVAVWILLAMMSAAVFLVGLTSVV